MATHRPAVVLSAVLLAALSLLLLPSVLAAQSGSAYLVRDLDTTGEPVVVSSCGSGSPGFCPPDESYYGGLPGQFLGAGDVLYFVANDRVHGNELWRSDGTEQGTWMVADVCTGECGSRPQLLGLLGETLYFWADDGEHGVELWRSDGTASGTSLFTEICAGPCDGNFPAGPLAAHRLAPVGFYGGSLFFEARPGAPDDVTRGSELWRTDGTLTGTKKVLDLCPSGVCTVAGGPLLTFEVLDQSLLVGVAATEAETFGLWRLDEPAGAPQRVSDALAPFSEMIGLGSRVVFVAYSPQGAGEELPARIVVASDGTAAGTRTLYDAQNATSPVRLGGKVYFVVFQGVGDGFWIWQTDGTVAGTSRAVRAPAPLADVDDVVAFDGELYFEGLDYNTLDDTLWRTVGGVSGTVDLGVSVAGRLRVVAGRLYFWGHDAAHGSEPWVTDGTVQGTRMVRDVRSGKDGSRPGLGPVAAGRLFFSADDGVHDRELWAIPLSANDGPPPPDAPPLTSSEFPGFRFWVRIQPPAGPSRIGTVSPRCLPETVCVTGALPDRIEVFLRIVGPKPNGRLWPTLVKFTTSEVEVWIEQQSTGELRYYDLVGARPGFDELPGLFDREGFEP